MTTDYSCLRFATEEHVAQILLDAPPVNCIGEGLLQDLEWLLDTLEHMPQLRAVVIGSTNPKIFCAGADVNQFLSWDAESGAKMSGWGNRIFDRIAALPVPVICAISGGAYGGGLELAMACDIRVADRTVKLALPECTLGVLPAYGGTRRLPQLVGKGRAAFMLCTGDPISGEEALACGLCDAVTEPGGALGQAMDIARRIADRAAPLALRGIKACLNGRGPEGVQSELPIENQWFGELCKTADRTEGVTAFRTRRKAEFRGE